MLKPFSMWSIGQMFQHAWQQHQNKDAKQKRKFSQSTLNKIKQNVKKAAATTNSNKNKYTKLQTKPTDIDKCYPSFYDKIDVD